MGIRNFRINQILFISLYQFNIEEMNLEKYQIVTTLQKYVTNTIIDTVLNQTIKRHNYQRKKIKSRCLDSQFIINIILYLIIREGNNETEIMKLQFEIKKKFAMLPGLPKSQFDPNGLSKFFLFQILLISNITHQITQQLKISSLMQIDPDTIFIIIVFLSTDKLVSPNCYKLLHQRLQVKQLPFGKRHKRDSIQCLQSQKDASEFTEAEFFKQEVRSIIHPKFEEKQRIKNSQSVGLMISKFKNKENMSHYRLNKALRESNPHSEVEICRPRKCFSQQDSNFIEMNQQVPVKRLKKYTWSKCELVKTNYVPFCSIKAQAVQKNNVMANSYLKFKKIKQKTVHFEEKHRHLFLKI